MLKIYQVESDKDRGYVRELFWEYLEWANAGLNEQFGINFAIEQMLEEDMLALNKFYPPQGRLLLAELDTRVAGLACMHQIRQDMGEIKRMYVRDEFRGAGVGRAVLDRLIIEARAIGCPIGSSWSERCKTCEVEENLAGLSIIKPEPRQPAVRKPAAGANRPLFLPNARKSFHPGRYAAPQR
jgi:GNAT superfamily N-acetyltransferase